MLQIAMDETLAQLHGRPYGRDWVPSCHIPPRASSKPGDIVTPPGLVWCLL